MRQLKREVKIGNVTIGGNNPIAVQTMLNVPVEDIEGNVAQAKRCEAAGCQILRVTCPSAADAKCIEAVKNAVNIPIVADIHFDYKAALACADVGVDKIRINPGNIGDDDRVKAVVQACQQKNIPIRIGVNGGSLEKHILAKYGAPVPEAMVESALYHVRLLEKYSDNSIIAQLGVPDMRIPIQYALTYPARVPGVVPELDFTTLKLLTFDVADEETFRCLAACKKAIKKGGLGPCAANGANEEAVKLFLEDKIGFLDIGRLVEAVVDSDSFGGDYTLADVYECDKMARAFVRAHL